MEREQYGFRRTRCGCDLCRAPCKHIPGSLDVEDLLRLCPENRDPFEWAEEHLTNDVDYERLAELLGRIIAPVPVAGVPLFAGWRTLAEPAAPKALTLQPYFVDVETRGELTRGVSVVDARPNTKNTPNVDLATGVDAVGVRVAGVRRLADRLQVEAAVARAPRDEVAVRPAAFEHQRRRRWQANPEADTAQGQDGGEHRR